MKEIFTTVRLTLFCALLLAIVYPLLIWSIAQLGPNQGQGVQGNHQGQQQFLGVGQIFNPKIHFLSRPSAVNYNAAGAGGSNKGPSNPDYLAEVKVRIDTLLAQNPGLQTADIPSDLVTASGSGLDPHISVQAARIQVKRVAVANGLKEEQIENLLEKQIERPFLGLFGPERVNVLKLNLALNKLRQG
jgi:potassium-transporting ATPase KdpC subunit